MTAPSPPAPPAVPLRTRLKEHSLRLWKRLAQQRRGLSWGAVILGGFVAAVALWPLAAVVWDLLGLTSVQAWRAAAAGIGAVLLAAGVVGVNWKPASGRTSERTSPVRLVWLILAAWAVAAGAVAAMTALAWLVMDTPRWQPPQELTPRNLDAIATRAFAIVAGLGGVALLVISYRRQRTTEEGEQREVVKLFGERFTAAYTELGSEHAAVRLGAVHALAHLADDAPSGEEVQMVIDVLCAYLRMPYDPVPEALPKNARKDRREEHRARELEFASSREVRHTIIRIIGDRLRKDTRWRGKDYDFTGAVFDGGDLHGAHFPEGEVSFKGARFTGGKVSFNGARFTGGLVDFGGAELTDGKVDFGGARFTGGKVSFGRAEFSDGQMDFGGARFTGATVSFRRTEFSGGKVNFIKAQFSGGKADFHRAQFTSGKVNFIETQFSGATVDFHRAQFTSGKVNFIKAQFSGATVDFHRAQFTSGKADFRGAGFTGGKVDFGWGGFAGDLTQFREAHGACPKGLPLDQTHADPRVLLAPRTWGEPSGHEDMNRSNEAPHESL